MKHPKGSCIDCGEPLKWDPCLNCGKLNQDKTNLTDDQIEKLREIIRYNKRYNHDNRKELIEKAMEGSHE